MAKTSPQPNSDYMASILQGLNDQQLDAVTTTDGPLLIIAGAGTGKTTVIARRIAYLIATGKAKPNEILALTFTDKAANEMEERVDQLVPYGTFDTQISTFHSFGERILRERALDLGLPSDFKILTRPQQVLFFQQNIFRFDLKYYRPLSTPTKFIQALIALISRAKDETIGPAEYRAYANSLRDKGLGVGNKGNSNALTPDPLHPTPPDTQEVEKQLELARCYEQYEEFKDQAGVLDFGDLINKTLELFQTNPAILKHYQTTFKYVLVDEYQDTNYAQNELVKLLVKSHNNICVVGDDDQCLPGDALISTPKGPKKIALIKEGETIDTAAGKGHVTTAKVSKVFRSKKQCRLLTFTTESGQKLTVTDNHKMFCYVPTRSEINDKPYWYVYLMEKRGLGFRIGVTRNLTQRLKLERGADTIIGLRAFSTEAEARYYEALWALRYGIPLGVFKERKGIAITGNLLEDLYRELDTYTNAQRLAHDLGINLAFPHYTLDAVTRGNGKRIKINLSMCQRRYVNKSSHFSQYLVKPEIRHELHLQTSNQEVISTLKENGIPLQKSKLGVRVRIVSTDIKKISNLADDLTKITKGYQQGQAALGIYHSQSLPALIMPAGNVMLGHYLPVQKNFKIVYEKVVAIDEHLDTQTVYDLEVNPTHNFIANGIVVHNSIYRFRGAAISNILAFQETYPDAKHVVLTENYRSTQPILDAAYKLITNNNPDRLEAKHNIDKHLISKKSESGFAIQTLYSSTLSDETDSVVAEIEHLMERGKGKAVRGKEDDLHPSLDVPLNYSDFCILVRANSHAESFLQALAAKGIPYKFTGTTGLYDQSEVRTLISFLSVIANFFDNLRLYDLITSSIYDMPMPDLVKLMHYSGKKSKSLYWTLEHKKEVAADLDLSEEGLAVIDTIIDDLATYSELSKKHSTGKVLYQFLQDKQVFKNLQAENTTEAASQIVNIAKFFDKILEFEKLTHNASIPAFVSFLDTMREAGDDPGTAPLDIEYDGVNVMTVHAAKGLEFKVVFIVNALADRFPSRDRGEAIPLPDGLIKETLPEGDFHIQEERRLFYVAMTRASDLLYITWAKDYGGKRLKKVSPFVTESLGIENLPEVMFQPSVTKKLDQLQLFYGNIPTLETPKETNQMTLLAEEERLLQINQAQVEEYLSCPKRYYYSTILKIPLARHHLFIYGSAIHAGIQAFYRAKMSSKPLTKDQLLEVFDRAWSNEGFLSTEHEQERYNQGKRVLGHFYDREMAIAESPTWIEKPFKLHLPNAIRLVGRMDRVDFSGDNAHIIDFKTTEHMTQEKAVKRAKDSLQLAIYALAFHKMFGILPSKLSLYFVEDGIMGSFVPSMETLKKAEDQINQAAVGIRQPDFTAKPEYLTCNYCAYNTICPSASIKG